MTKSFFRLIMALCIVFGLGLAGIAHASGPCVPQMESQALSPAALSDCAQGFLRTPNGTIPCGKLRAGCIAAAFCYSNIGLAASDIMFPIFVRAEAKHLTMRSTFLHGVGVAPLLHPPASRT